MSMKEPKLSIIIPWRNRPEIQTTLQANQSIFNAHDVEVIVVNCGGDNEQILKASAGTKIKQLQCLELGSGQFNKALALNIGAFAARSKRLFFLDTDILLKEDFLSSALAMLDEGCFVTVDRVFESQQGTKAEPGYLEEFAHVIELLGKDNRKARIETNRVRFSEASRSAPGLVMLERQHFLQVEGMNSDLEGWGWEDLDLLVRLQFVLNISQRRTGAVVHLTHSDQSRNLGGQTRTASEQLNSSICIENYRVGHFLGTYSDDAARWSDKLVAHRTGKYP